MKKIEQVCKQLILILVVFILSLTSFQMVMNFYSDGTVLSFRMVHSSLDVDLGWIIGSIDVDGSLDVELEVPTLDVNVYR